MFHKFISLRNNNKLEKFGKIINEYHHQFYFDKINTPYKKALTHECIATPKELFLKCVVTYTITAVA